MKDGLEKKGPSSLVLLALPYLQKNRKNIICYKVLYTNSRWSKGGQDQPKIRNK